MALTEMELTEKIEARWGRQIQHMLRQAALHPWGGRGVIDPRHRLQTDSLVAGKDLVVSILLTFDRGPHAGGWWRNSQYDACWHVSIVGIRPPKSRLLINQTPEFEEVPEEERKAWCRAILQENVSKAWNEPPASKLDAHRTAPPSSNTWHCRVFVDREGHAIVPEGEVYTLIPWDDGTSPEKVYR